MLYWPKFGILIGAMAITAGCIAIVHEEPAPRERRGGDSPVSDRTIASYFELAPELKVPARIAVVEFGTTEFSRLFALPAGAAPDPPDPLLPGETVATVMPFTGSSLLGDDFGEANLRLAAARAQADVLVLVDYRYRNSIQKSVFSILNYILIGAVIPTEVAHTEVAGRATIVDVRNGLICGISEARARSPDRLCTALKTRTVLERDRGPCNEELYRVLAARAIDQIRLAHASAKPPK